MARNEFQLLVRLLDNKTLTLHFPIQQAPVPVQSIKQQIQSITEIPSQFQKLTLNGKFISDETEIHKTHSLSTINLTFSLVGGKGGFGSLLRGAATKAGQKKTNNFDACRDMSGRRLRHVNAEKRLEEWKAEEEDRRLEKMADEYLKKMAKTAKKEGRNGSGNGAAERYVEKYREVSERCVKDVERSVRESAAELMVGKKRKLLERLRKKDVKEDGETKKLKTGNGKRTIGESDDDDDDSDEDFLDDIHIKEDEVKGKRIGCGGCLLPDTSSEDDNETVTRESSTSSIDGIALNVSLFPDVYGSIESISDSEVQKDDHGEKALGAAPQGMSSSPEIVETEKGDSGTCIVTIEPSTVSNKVEAHLGSQDVEAASGVDEVLAADAEKLNDESSIQPLNFNDYSSAAELEVLGLERLKLELQSRGLKCGGTLQERAARLFLLKITPIEKLPKKLLAKK